MGSSNSAPPSSLPCIFLPLPLQALWLVKMLKGELTLPSVQEMKEDVRLQQR